MNNFYYKKSLLLSAIFIASLTGSSINSGIYDAFGFIGRITDGIISKGDISKEDEQLFNETAKKLGIDTRNIKIKNSGTLLRLILGYNNAAYLLPTNRVYANANCLKEMTTEQKRFLFAHELAHSQKNHTWKRMAALGVLTAAKKAIIITAAQNGLINKQDDNIIKKYLTYGINNKIIDLSLIGLILAQILQAQETEADATAIKEAGATVKVGTEFLTSHLTYPDTKNWPLYAKIQLKISQLLHGILSLPGLKQHAHHLVSLNDRINNLENLSSNAKTAQAA